MTQEQPSSVTVEEQTARLQQEFDELSAVHERLAAWLSATGS